MSNEIEHLYHSHLPDSGGLPDFVLPGNVEFALLHNIVNRECFSEFKQKSQKFNFPLTGRVVGTVIAAAQQGR